MKKIFENKKIPKNLEPLFWSYDFDSLSLKKSKKHVVKQILNYGDMDDWEWLVSTYGKENIREMVKQLYASEFNPATLKLIKLIFKTEPVYENRGARFKKEKSF